jgi:hypothetical protein
MTQNYEIKEMKVRDNLHIDIIHKCLEVPSIPSLNIKDPCGWTCMPCFHHYHALD